MLRVLSKFSIPNVLLSIEFPVSNLQYKLHKMTMLRKIIDYESLGNSQENVYGGVYVSKIASLQRNNYKSIISRFRKLAVLEKSLWCTSVLVILTKTELIAVLSKEALKSLIKV